jgi:hypothetical protein
MDYGTLKNYFPRPKKWDTMKLFEKIQYTFSRFTPDFGKFVHKLDAKRIVKELAGDTIEVPRVVREMAEWDDISPADLNPDHIIKATHGSGFNINIEPGVTYNMNYIKQMLQRFNRMKYLSYRESQYKYVKNGFFIEEKVDDYMNGKNGNAITFMIYCIYGTPYTLIMSDKRLDRYRHFTIHEDYRMEQIPIENQVYHPFIIPEQEVLNRMFDGAKKLSKPFEFVRIDFYLSTDNKIYFSEFTLTPHAGLQIYSDDMELQLGKLWI